MLLKFLLAAGLAVMGDSQHLPKIGRIPGISSSLVNLGKLDISFHFNNNGGGKSDQRTPNYLSVLPAANSFIGGPQPSGVCPCMRNSMKETSRGNPMDFFSKILTSNNLFTNNKEPISSSLCCGGSTEQVEETIIVDLTKPQARSFSNAFPPLSIPFALDTLLKPQARSFSNVLPALSMPFALDTLSKAPSLPRMPLQNPKGFEIYLYPNKKDMIKIPKKMRKSLDIDNEGIHPVGVDKALPNEFLNIRAFEPISTSVKKDLNIQEKAMGKIEEEPAKEAKDIKVEMPKSENVTFVNDPLDVEKGNSV